MHYFGCSFPADANSQTASQVGTISLPLWTPQALGPVPLGDLLASPLQPRPGPHEPAFLTSSPLFSVLRGAQREPVCPPLCVRPPPTGARRPPPTAVHLSPGSFVLRVCQTRCVCSRDPPYLLKMMPYVCHRFDPHLWAHRGPALTPVYARGAGRLPLANGANSEVCTACFTKQLHVPPLLSGSSVAPLEPTRGERHRPR